MHRQRRRQRNPETPSPRLSHWLLILFLSILCMMVLIQTSRERRLALADLTAAEAATEQLRTENQRIKEEIRAVAEDPKVIERIARDELNMLRRDELVFSFPKEKSESGASESTTAPPTPR